MTTVIDGCGKDILDCNGKPVIACSDHIDIDVIDDIQYVEPVLCDDCWKIQKEKIQRSKNQNDRT